MPQPDTRIPIGWERESWLERCRDIAARCAQVGNDDAAKRWTETALAVEASPVTTYRSPVDLVMELPPLSITPTEPDTRQLSLFCNQRVTQ